MATNHFLFMEKVEKAQKQARDDSGKLRNLDGDMTS